MEDYINFKNLKHAKQNEEFINFQLDPIEYIDGRKPRLPRKSSKHYNLRSDTKLLFQEIFKRIDREADLKKYKIELTVFCGLDRLGGADLDNYCKAILDGVTYTKKVWVDDRQVDELKIIRRYTEESYSFIDVNIFELE